MIEPWYAAIRSVGNSDAPSTAPTGRALRFMDSLVIYTEAYVVSRGGPGVSTTFLSHELVQTATIQFDLGEGGAMAVIYFLIVLCVAWAFFNLIVTRDRANGART